MRMGPGSMYGLGQVKCKCLVILIYGSEPVMCESRPMVGIRASSMYGFYKDQCTDWATPNVSIKPVQCGDWARFNVWIGPGSMYRLGQAQC